MKIGLGIGIPFIRNYISSLFDPSKLFTGSTNGVWYDPSDTTTLFRGAPGTTPVTAVEQPVGLILDKSKGLVLGSELVDTANTAAAWTPISLNIVTQDGDAVKIETVDNPVGATLLLNQIGGLSVDMVSNRWYVLTAEVKINTGSAQVLLIYGGNGTSAVTFTSTAYIPIKFYVLKTTSNDITLRFNQLSSPETVWIRNISVRELPGNHAFNSSGNSANFPVLSARYNLLTKTEQFQQSPWAAYNSTIQDNTSDTLDPRGGNNASKAIYAGAAASFYVDVAINTSYTYSIYAKKGTYDVASVAVAYVTPAPSATFNLTSGVASGTNCTATMTSIGNDWWLCKIAFTASGSARIVNYCGTTTGHNLYYFGADLRVANDALNQPAYQRVNTSTDYDTVGFKPYLRFNGTNQWLQTNSIDFTYGDKMFVSAGVRKLSDVGFNTVAMLSADWGLNYGAFTLYAPGDTYKYYFGSGGTSLAAASATGAAFNSPITHVISGIGDISGDRAILRINNSQVAASTANQGTGNYGNYPLYIGACAGSSLWFNGRLYSLIVAGKLANAVEITETEKYVNGKTAAY